MRDEHGVSCYKRSVAGHKRSKWLFTKDTVWSIAWWLFLQWEKLATCYHVGLTVYHVYSASEPANSGHLALVESHYLRTINIIDPWHVACQKLIHSPVAPISLQEVDIATWLRLQWRVKNSIIHNPIIIPTQGVVPPKYPGHLTKRDNSIFDAQLMS